MTVGIIRSYHTLTLTPRPHARSLLLLFSRSIPAPVPLWLFLLTIMVSKNSELNPTTTSYEFLGPPGAFFVTIGVPIMTYALYFGCSEATGGCPPPVSIPTVTDALQSWSWWASLWDTEAALAYLAWYAFCVVAWAVLPGDWVEGTQLRNGKKQKYKINGMPRFDLRSSDSLTADLFVSILDIVADPRRHDRCNYHIWCPPLDLHLRQMGWSRHSLHLDVCGSGTGMLHRILP